MSDNFCMLRYFCDNVYLARDPYVGDDGRGRGRGCRASRGTSGGVAWVPAARSTTMGVERTHASAAAMPMRRQDSRPSVASGSMR